MKKRDQNVNLTAARTSLAAGVVLGASLITQVAFAAPIDRAHGEGEDAVNGLTRYYLTASGNDSNEQAVSMSQVWEFLGVPDSPLLAKREYDFDEDKDDLSEAYSISDDGLTNGEEDAIQFSESNFKDDPDKNGDATIFDFEYDKGADDLALLYVVTKSDGGFRVHFWDSDDADGNPDPVTTGQVRTFINQEVDLGDNDAVTQPEASLSHVSYYDTGTNEDEPDQSIPLPGTIWFLGSVLIGLGILGRRERASA